MSVPSTGSTHHSDGECIAAAPRAGLLKGGQYHQHNFGKAAGS